MALASAFAPVSGHVPGPGAKDSTTLTKFGIGGASAKSGRATAKSGRATAKSGRAIVKSGCAPVTTPVPVFGYDGVPFYTGLVSVGRGVFAMQDCHGFWVHVRPIVVDIYKDDEGEGEGDVGDEVEGEGDGVPFYTGLVSVGRGVFAMQDCHGFWVHVRPIVVDIYKDDEGEGEGDVGDEVEGEGDVGDEGEGDVGDEGEGESDDEVEPVVPIAPLVNVRAPSAKIVDARGITRVAVTCRGADDCDNGHCTFAHPSEGDQRAMFCPDPKCPTQVRLRANKGKLRTYYRWRGARVCNHAHWVV